MSKIICPFHDDSEPSLHVYENGAKCFVCGIFVHDLNSLGMMKPVKRRKAPENIQERIEQIKSLPTKLIRGFNLPYDEKGYYLVWPDSSYYKMRNWLGKARYVGPSGHKPPLFKLEGEDNILIIVEGEFNALSLWITVQPQPTIVSPGSATELTRHIKYYLDFKRIHVFVDKDAPGVVYGSYLKDQLLQHGRRASLTALEKDFNETLQTEGPEAIRAIYNREVGMPGYSAV